MNLFRKMGATRVSVGLAGLAIGGLLVGGVSLATAALSGTDRAYVCVSPGGGMRAASGDSQCTKNETQLVLATASGLGRVETALDAETLARTAADATLGTAAATEAGTRLSADSALTSRTDTLTTGLAQEMLARGTLDTRLTTALGTETSARTGGDSFLQGQVTSLENKHVQNSGLIGALNTAVFGSNTVEGLRETVTRQGAGLYGLTTRVATLEAATPPAGVAGSFFTVWAAAVAYPYHVDEGLNYHFAAVGCGAGAIAVSGMWHASEGFDVSTSQRFDALPLGSGWEVIFHRRALPLGESNSQAGVVCWQPPA